MPFDVLTFVLDKVVAANKGVGDQRSTQLGLLGAMLPLGQIPSLVITQAIAQREAGTVSLGGATTGTPPPPIQVQVPNVTGSSFATAQTSLQSFGLQAQRQDVLSNTVAKDIVISQNPAAGSTVPINSSVILNVSLGVVVPDVTSQPFVTAQAQLQALGFQVQRVDQHSTTVPSESVISQDPSPGSTLSAGGAITLTVSLGSNVSLPSVVARAFANAQSQLQALGLQVQRVDQSSSAINSGFVISQNPTAGTLVTIGSTVTLTVSTGQDFALPDVVGQLFTDAQTLLQSKNLHVQRVDQASDAVRQDFVISQDPVAGTVVAPGLSVTLVVSQGTAQVTLPDVRGKLFAEARETLQDLNFAIVRRDVPSTETAETVIDQDPKPGSVPPGTQVTLSVSTGSAQQYLRGKGK